MSGLSARIYSCGGDAGRFFFDGGEAALVLQPPFLRYASRVPALGNVDESSSSVSIDSADESEDKSESDIVKGLMGWLSIMRDRVADRWVYSSKLQNYRDQAR